MAQRRSSSMLSYESIVQAQLEGKAQACKVFIKLNNAADLNIAPSEDGQNVGVVAVKLDATTVRLKNPDAYSRQPEKDYKYDKIYDENVNNEEIYRDVAEYILDAINGVNVTVVAQGALGSGKSYVLAGTKTDFGIIPRAINDIFTIVDNQVSADSSNHFHVEMSYIELYNNNFINLLKSVNVEELFEKPAASKTDTGNDTDSVGDNSDGGGTGGLKTHRRHRSDDSNTNHDDNTSMHSGNQSKGSSSFFFLP